MLRLALAQCRCYWQKTQTKIYTTQAYVVDNCADPFPTSDEYPDGSGPTTSTASFADVATGARAVLDAQAAAAAANKTELVYDPARKFGQLVDFSSMDNRSLSAITLNQDQKFSNQEIYAAKKELDSRTRASILSSLKQSQQSGDPSQLSLGILQSYSAMSDEERQASGWTASFRDNVLQSYKTTSNILSILQGS